MAASRFEPPRMLQHGSAPSRGMGGKTAARGRLPSAAAMLNTVGNNPFRAGTG